MSFSAILDGLSYFYIYDWNESIIDSWPSNSSHHRISIDGIFKSNFGAGIVIDKSKGLYHTHQYSLFELFYRRLKMSRYRTMNPIDAKLFFIPYDIGMDATTRQSDGGLIRTNCPKRKQVMNLISRSKYFHKSKGNNHFLIHSINQMMIYYTNPTCTKELLTLCMNCMKLSIDTYPAKMYPYLDNAQYMTNKWISIPFPSSYHYNDMIWKNRTIWLSDQIDIDNYFIDRKVNLCFIGSDQITVNSFFI